MYKLSCNVYFKNEPFLYLLFLFGCAEKQPVLEKYGWHLIDEKNIPVNFVEDELCHSHEGYFDEKVWYISQKNDYLIFDKASLFVPN